MVIEYEIDPQIAALSCAQKFVEEKKQEQIKKKNKKDKNEIAYGQRVINETSNKNAYANGCRRHIVFNMNEVLLI